MPRSRAWACGVAALAVGCGRIGFDAGGPSGGERTIDAMGTGGDGAGSSLPDAASLDVVVTPVSSGGAIAACPLALWTGSDLRLVWADYRASAQRLYHARVALDGSVTVPEVPFGRTSMAGLECPYATWTGTQAAVTNGVYMDGVYLYLLDASGGVQQETLIGGGPGEDSSAAIAWSGSRLGILYTHTQAQASDALFVAASSAGTLLGGEVTKSTEPLRYMIVPRSPGFALSIISAEGSNPNQYVEVDGDGATTAAHTVGPSLDGNSGFAHDGARYAIVAAVGDRVSIALGDATSPATVVEEIVGATDAVDARIVAAPGGFGVSWSRQFVQSYFARLDADGQLVGPVMQFPDGMRVESVIWAGDRWAATTASASGALSLVTFQR